MPLLHHRIFAFDSLRQYAFHIGLVLVFLNVDPLHARSGNANSQSRSTQTLESNVNPLVNAYCVDCHGKEKTEGDLNLEELINGISIAKDFKTWELVAEMLEFEDMPPPEESEQPSSKERSAAIGSIGETLESYMREFAGDPGEVRLRRLTSAEYAYSIQDLTGLDLYLEKDFADEAVGGEGFSNVGSVQFMQDSNLERYLAAAKRVASHAIIGAGPLRFYEDPGLTGQELSAINRIRKIYRENGFRTGAGEGANAYGIEMYEKAFFVAWKFRHRKTLGLRGIDLADLAKEEGVSVVFAKSLWNTLNQRSPGFPTRNIVDAWNRIPAPTGDSNVSETEIRMKCSELYQYLFDWQKTLAASSIDDEEYPVLTDDSFVAKESHSFSVGINRENDSELLEFEIRVMVPDDDQGLQPAIVWKNPTMRILPEPGGESYDQPLRELVDSVTAEQLKFGQGPNGAEIGPDDFVVYGRKSMAISVVLPTKLSRVQFRVDVELNVELGDDCIARIEVTDGSSAGETVSSTGAASALLSNPDSPQLVEWTSGISVA
jgi:hypothetical protein